MPNAVMKAKSERRRPFIGDQVEECRDASGLFYILPHQKVTPVFEACHVCCWVSVDNISDDIISFHVSLHGYFNQIFIDIDIKNFWQGYLVNWDVQKTVWDYLFGKDVFNVNHTNTTMIVTEPYFNFSSIQEGMSEIFFEEYDVDALLRINGEIMI